MLKLRARDAEDIQVISAVLQDAIAPVCDMIWRADDKNFVMVTQRLCREDANQTKLNRICCALNITGVEAVQTLGFDPNNRALMLDLLMVKAEGDTLHFLFAGNAAIRLRLNTWSMIVEDFGEAWPAGCEPCHEDKIGARA